MAPLLLLLALLGNCLALPFEYPVSEDVPVGHVIANLAQEFNVDPRSPSHSLQITNQHSTEGAGYFAINASTGELYVKSPPDRDNLCEEKEDCLVELIIAHGDSRDPEVTSLRVRLRDVNDNAPTFPERTLEIRVREEREPRLVTAPIPQAQDPDLGQNTVQRYVLDGSPEETLPFGVDQKPMLLLHQKLDRERKAEYNFRVLARDGGRRQLTGTLTVKVIVDDINDHKPQFERSSYGTIIAENTAEGTDILRIKATDKDAGDNGRVSYRMARALNREEMLAKVHFDVYSHDGEAQVRIKKTVDIDKKPNLYYRFRVEAFDHGASSLSNFVPVTIRVRDVNDDKPSIRINYIQPDGPITTRGLLNENEARVFIAIVSVTDRDSGPGGLVSCAVDSDNFMLRDLDTVGGGGGGSVGMGGGHSKSQTKKYKLINQEGVDRENTPQISFLITCHDNAISQKSMTKLKSTARVEVRVVDKNDEAPRFQKETYNFYLRENAARNGGEVEVGRVAAMDKDEGDNAKVSYFLVDDAHGAFRIDTTTGTLFARRSFDREITDHVMLKVKAVDNGAALQQSSTVEVKVDIADVNDNAPVFKTSELHFAVVENSRALHVGRVEATDRDKDENARLKYRIVESDESMKLFTINTHTGLIHLNARLDREKRAQYSFRVLAIDSPRSGERRLTGTATVTVSVLDENDNSPTIVAPDSNVISVIQDTEAIGRDLFTMRATDPDEGINGTVFYSVLSGSENYFSIDKTAGIFYVTRKLEGLHNKMFSVVLQASDNGVRPRNSTITVRIRVRSEAGMIPAPEVEHEVDSETGRTLIVVATTVLLLLVLAAVALLVMLRMRRPPLGDRRQNDGEFEFLARVIESTGQSKNETTSHTYKLRVIESTSHARNE